MGSKHLDEELSTYLSGELDSVQSATVEQHLANCSICTEKLKMVQQLTGLLSEADEIQPTTGFADGVLQRVDEERRVIAFRSRRTIAWLAAAAAIAFVVLLLSIQKENRPSVTISQQRPKVQSPLRPPAGSSLKQEVSPEDAELISNLDAVENMDLIENYDNLENMETAFVAGEEGNAE